MIDIIFITHKVIAMRKLTLVFILVCMPLKAGFSQDLLETYQLALSNDPQFNSAGFNQQANTEIKSQSIAQMLPHLSSTVASLRKRLDNRKASYLGSGQQNYWDHSFALNLTQPVFHWEHWIQLDQSDNQIALADAQLQAALQALMMRTTSAYFNVLAAVDNLAFAVAEKKAIEKQLEQAKQHFEVGLIAITDVYEAQAGFDHALANEIEAQNNVDNSKEALREIIGDNTAELNSLQTSIAMQNPEPADISAWSEAADANNFSIVAEFNQAEIARKTIELQESRHLPTLDVIASYGIQDVNSSFGLRGETQSVGMQLNVPLYEGGMVNSRSRQAAYQYQAAKESLVQVRRRVTREVKNAYRGVASSISKVKALEATIQSAELAVKATEAGFEVGTRTMVDVLTMQRALYKAKSEYARSRYDYLINSIKLKEAAGSLNELDLQQINQYL